MSSGSQAPAPPPPQGEGTARSSGQAELLTGRPSHGSDSKTRWAGQGPHRRQRKPPLRSRSGAPAVRSACPAVLSSTLLHGYSNPSPCHRVPGVLSTSQGPGGGGGGDTNEPGSRALPHKALLHTGRQCRRPVQKAGCSGPAPGRAASFSRSQRRKKGLNLRMHNINQQVRRAYHLPGGSTQLSPHPQGVPRQHPHLSSLLPHLPLLRG